VKISEIDNKFTEVIKGSGITGFEAGLFLRQTLGPVYIKPKLLLDYQRGELQFIEGEAEHSVNFNAGKILIPVLVGFKFIPILSLEGGPVFNHILFVTKDFDGNHVDIKKDGIGYRIGLNAELSILNLTVSYQGIKNNGSITSSSSYQTPDQLVFGIGLGF